MRVIVTGCNGQVGHCLVEQLKGKAEVLALDVAELDITDEPAVKETVKAFNPDYIINAAAHTAVDKAETDIESSYLINRDGPRFLAQAANKVGAVMLHISTDYVFDGNKEGLYVESDVTSPQGVYGQSKLAGEMEVAKACNRHIILRTAWVFGEHGNNFVKTMLRLGQERDSLGIVGDQFGGPTFAGDIASVLITIAEETYQKEAAIWGVYHFSGMPYVSWFEFANTIFDKASSHEVIMNKPNLSLITTSDYQTPAKRPQNSKLDCTKITNQFSIKPSNWIAALERIQEYK